MILLAWAAVITLAGIVAADFAVGPPLVYDTGLYHMSAVRWAGEYSIIPGLGNLHGRLAFNNSSFLLAALMDWGPLRGMSHHIGNGLLLAVLLARIMTAARRALAPSGEHRARETMLALLLLPVVAVGSWEASSPGPDWPVFCLGIVVASELAALLLRPAGEAPRDGERVFTVCFLSAVGLSVKMTFLAFGAAAAGVALGVWFAREAGVPPGRDRRVALAAVAAPALVIVTWMARGICLSGYPAYPSPLLGFPVERRVPREDVAAMERLFYTWVRDRGAPPEEVLASWRWLGPWLARTAAKRIEFQAPAVVLAFAGGIGAALALARRRGDGAPGPPRAAWLLVAPPVSAAVFWFLTSPDIRYPGPFFWILAAGAAALAVERARGAPGAWRVARPGALALWAAMALYSMRIALVYANGPSPEGGFRPTPVARTVVARTAGGLEVRVPAPDAEDRRLWDAALPCAPRLDPRLRLRRPGDLAGGFMISEGLEGGKP